MANWGEGAKGAAGGAGLGAAVGSVVPGVGTAIGAGAGALLGGAYGLLQGEGNPYEEEMRRRSRQRAPSMRAAQGDYSSFRGNQAELIAMLEAQSRGEGPSLAQAQLQAATDRNQKGQQALAAGAQGPNAMLAQFQAMQNSAGLGAQAAQDAALARIQEQYNAQNQLGLTLHGARGYDESMNQFNVGQRNQAGQANLAANLSQQGLNAGMLGAAATQSQVPTWGDKMLAGGAGAFTQYASGGMGGAGGGGGMSPIAAGNPGAGGYFTPGGGAPTGTTGLFNRPGYAPL